MCPPPDPAATFAARILDELLLCIEVGNAHATVGSPRRQFAFLVSHAWTDGAAMYLVYSAPPSDRTWGLARDTRESLINPSRWNAADDPAEFYYLLDLEENWPGRRSRQPGEDPDLIWWSGDQLTDLPEQVSTLSDAHRYTRPEPPSVERPRPVLNEPRRYADPNGPLRRRPAE